MDSNTFAGSSRGASYAGADAFDKLAIKQHARTHAKRARTHARPHAKRARGVEGVPVRLHVYACEQRTCELIEHHLC